MIQLKNKELYLYGTLLALSEEQAQAINDLANGKIGWFGKTRIAARGEKITSFINELIKYKKRYPDKELSEIPAEIRSLSALPEMIAVIVDLQNIKFKNSNFDKFYPNTTWTTLESYLGYKLENPSELEDVEQKSEPVKTNEIPSDLQFDKEYRDKKFENQLVDGQEEGERMQLRLQISGLKRRNENLENEIEKIKKKLSDKVNESKKEKLKTKKKSLEEYIKGNDQEIIELDASLNELIRSHEEAKRERSIDLNEKKDLEKFKNFFEEGLITEEVYLDILKRYTQ